MVVVAANRKRGFECFSLTAIHRFCRHKPVSPSNAAISPQSRYPAGIRREFHAHRRGFLRFRLLVRSPVFKRKPKPAFRFLEKDNQVIDVEDDPFLHSISVDDRDPLEDPHEPFVLLKEEEKAQVKSAFSGRNRMKVLVSHKNSNIDIRGETLQCLRPTKWLNDEVINLYLQLLKERETRDPLNYFKCHFFNTFFYIKLVGGAGYNYEAVRRWTTQRKLGYYLIDCDLIFVPIHGGVHWTLAVINNRECKFLYFDPLSEVGPTKILNDLAKYLVDEVKDKSGKDIDVCSWEFEYVKDLPRQQNGYDCGMFMLKYIDFYSRGLRLQFSQENMPYFRLRTAKEILRLRAH